MTATPQGIPAKPWRVFGSNSLHEDYPSKMDAYDAVRELNDWDHAATVYTWVEGVWVLYEIAEPVPPPPGRGELNP
jgi:hypothetical protein